MLIILEGCDGSGKSTLAKSLAAILDAEIIHCSQFTPNDYDFFSDIIMASRERNIIADRFCYGQFVYQEEWERPLSGMYNEKNDRELKIVTIGKREFTFSNCDSSLINLHKLEALMLEYGTKVILVDAPTEEIEERLELRNEVVINGKSVKEVQAGFRAVMNLSMLRSIHWNTGREWL